MSLSKHCNPDSITPPCEIDLYIRSKTFLFGEYLVLEKGPSVILLTNPRFKAKFIFYNNLLEDNKSYEDYINCLDFHPQSLAGQLIKNNFKKFRDVEIKFYDPHEQLGGFGASSAQYIFAFTWLYFKNSEEFNKSNWKYLNPEEKQTFLNNFIKNKVIFKEVNILRDDSNFFKECFENHQSILKDLKKENQFYLSSGSDLISQIAEGCSLKKIEVNSKFSVTDLNSYFQKKNSSSVLFRILKTGNKINTHEHLEKLQPLNKNQIEKLSKIVCKGVKSLQNLSISKEKENFFNSVNSYYDEMKEMNLVCSKSVEIIGDILEENKDHGNIIKAIKSCGALGADSFILFYSQESDMKIIDNFKSLKKFKAVSASPLEDISLFLVENKSFSLGRCLESVENYKEEK